MAVEGGAAVATSVAVGEEAISRTVEEVAAAAVDEAVTLRTVDEGGAGTVGVVGSIAGVVALTVGAAVAEVVEPGQDEEKRWTRSRCTRICPISFPWCSHVSR